MQQLDLFASFQPEPPVKEKPVEADVLAEEATQPVIVADETLIEIEDEQTDVAASPQPLIEHIIEPLSVEPASSKAGSVVFVDEKIAVKIKPKIPVTIRQPEQRKEVATLIKPKAKRGRKSYKEIDAELDLIEIPEDEVLNQKMYYSITEVAKWFRVNASLLRYWENEFDILKPRKNRKGDRLFRPEDIKNLQVIYYLLRNRKFSLEGAKKYLRNNRQQADVNVQLAQSLTKFRSFLLELKANLGA